jgi:hypothetical protein
LEILCKNDFKYPISSLEWAYTLREFGKQKYKPAIPILIEDLGAASLNVVEEAFNSLKVFYPDSPSNFSSIKEMKTYFQNKYSAPNHGMQADAAEPRR